MGCGEHHAQLPFGKTLRVHPFQIVNGNVENAPPFVFAVRHLVGQQFLQNVRVRLLQFHHPKLITIQLVLLSTKKPREARLFKGGRWDLLRLILLLVEFSQHKLLVLNTGGCFLQVLSTSQLLLLSTEKPDICRAFQGWKMGLEPTTS